jgi:hypothetical protein
MLERDFLPLTLAFCGGGVYNGKKRKRGALYV